MTSAARVLSGKDKFIIAMMAFFVLVALVLELPWILWRDRLPALADQSWIANLYRIYGDADRAYYDQVNYLSSALETLNVFVTQFGHFWLTWAIWKNRAYRHVLQIVIGSYLSYSLILYFWSMHIDGYAMMRYRAPWTYFLFYATNMPWLLFNAFLVWDSGKAIRARFELTPTPQLESA